MAFDDILAAITAHTNEKITLARKEHQVKLSAVRQKNEDDLEDLQKQITEQKEAKKIAMTLKASAKAESIVKNAELSTKQDLLEKFYAAVSVAMGKLDDTALTKVFQKMLSSLPSDGTIHPAKNNVKLLEKLAGTTKIGEPIDANGGFIFVSTTQERDCTFESVTRHTIRPSSEVTVAHNLFS